MQMGKKKQRASGKHGNPLKPARPAESGGATMRSPDAKVVRLQTRIEIANSKHSTIEQTGPTPDLSAKGMHTMLDDQEILFDDQEFLSTKEASKYLGIPRHKLYYLVWAYLLEPSVCGKRFIYEKRELDAMRQCLSTFRWPRISLATYRECRDELSYR
jgi:hypothetical protein